MKLSELHEGKKIPPAKDVTNLTGWWWIGEFGVDGAAESIGPFSSKKKATAAIPSRKPKKGMGFHLYFGDAESIEFPAAPIMKEDVVHVDFKAKGKTDDAEMVGKHMGVRVLKKGEKLPAGAEKISMTQAFGSPELAALETAGVELTEKPGYWDDFEGDGYAVKNNIHEIKLKKIEKTLGKLKEYDGEELFGGRKPKGPQVSPKIMPKENMFIVKFHSDDTSYLCDLTGARTYIRNWQKIV